MPDSRQLLLFALIAALVGLAWWGGLDRVAEGYVNDSLLDAGIIYGVARGINALVSTLQGTELDILVLTISVGQVLDPVNDLIERFSGVMTIAIASLVIQQLLLVIVSHVSFTVGLTVLALLVIAMALLRRYYLDSNATQDEDSASALTAEVILRLFLLAVFLRFSLGLVVVANLWVDQVFLPGTDAMEFRVMQSFKGELEQIDDTVRDSPRATSTIAGQFDAIEERIERFADSSIRLMGALLLKAVILPVLFLWAMYLVGRAVLSRSD